MSLLARFTKSNTDKAAAALYPWTQRKLGGSHSNVLARYGHAAALALPSDNLVIYGGIHNKSKKDLFLIDTASMSASSINAAGDVPSPRKYSILVPLGNHAVLLYGGEPSMPDEKWDPHFYTLNLNTKQWNRLQMSNNCLPVERSGHSAAVANDYLYIWGGQRAGRYLNDMFVFNLSTYLNNPRWEYVTANNEGPAGRSGHVSVIYENKLYIFGGTDGIHLYNDVWSFDLQTRCWVQVSAVGFIPIPREGCGAALVGDVLYVFGGRGPDGQELDDLCAFKLRGHMWFMFRNMGPSPSPRSGLTLTAISDRIIAIGGETGIGKADESPSMIHILECSRIKYPPEKQTPSITGVSPSSSMQSLTTNVDSGVGSLSTQTHQNAEPSPVPRADSLSSRETPESSSVARSAYADLQQNTVQQSLAQRPPPPRHMSTVPEAALRRPRTASPLPPSDICNDDLSKTQSASASPTPPPTSGSDAAVRDLSPALTEEDSRLVVTTSSLSSPPRPPRPSREGVSLTGTHRQDAVSVFVDPRNFQGLQTDVINYPLSTQINDQAHQPSSTQQQEEIEALLREIKARDAIISEMKRKESWWRNEVSTARRMRSAATKARHEEDDEDSVDADEAMLMALSDTLEDAKVSLFEQLVSAKAELRRIKSSMHGSHHQALLSEKMEQVDRVRTAALQEAAYFKSKYVGLANRQPFSAGYPQQLTADLEHKLTMTLTENESHRRQLQQLNKHGNHDQLARESAEERAKEAHERAQEAMQAHKRALQEVEHLHQRASLAEAQVRENARKIADLTQQLTSRQSAANIPALSSEEQALQAKMAQLKEANAKVQGEAQELQRQLDESAESISHLRATLEEREQALQEAERQLQSTSSQIAILKGTMCERGLAAAVTMTTPSTSSSSTQIASARAY